ncbi:hypothetical protein EON67_03500, partial [archaeon]
MCVPSHVQARHIFDSRGNPTVEVDVVTDLGTFRAAVPSGASTGIYEALELRDTASKAYGGKGVETAVSNVNNIIGPALIGRDVRAQREIDEFMVQVLDGSKTENGWTKSKLGANAILGVSMAVCRAGAAAAKLPLYAYISTLAGRTAESAVTLPVPFFSTCHPAVHTHTYTRARTCGDPPPSSGAVPMCADVLNAGEHSGAPLVFQEFMIAPTGAASFTEAMRMGAEVYAHLKTVIKKRYG